MKQRLTLMSRPNYQNSHQHPAVHMAFGRLQDFEDDRKHLKAMIRPKRPRKITGWIPEQVRHPMRVFEMPNILTEWKKIIKQNAINQRARLPNLTSELFLQISENLSWPDNVSLGLSCKQLADKTQYARKHYAKIEDTKKSAGLALKGTRATRAAPAKPKAIFTRAAKRKIAPDANKSMKAPTKFVRLDLLRQIHDFFPKRQYRLCYGCINYVPRVPSNSGWGGDNRFQDVSWDSKIAYEMGPRCKFCVERERLERCATKAEMDQLKRMVARI
jgi:hypothetical protein